MARKKSQLYSSLSQSCDELCGGMDASQYKDYTGLVPIRQERHFVHIDHQEVRRPAAPLPDPALAIRLGPLLEHIQVLFATQLIHKAR